ncbi:zinc finger SWIM domain-containing protein [Calothrix sp. NIES-4071]|nr:zinc finger SWIM domain-containing protein [Calothrix sp. NIES-4071]BAZ57324.1 zinc finger SWIM domain-containing protein [Calothrix sp. NIES-4105]
MSGVDISELVIRDKSNAQSFQRGDEYFRTGMVSSLTKRGKQVQAEVKGSEQEPYRVTIIFDNDGLNANCTCPYSLDGWCKHIVATALTCARQPNSILERPPLPQLLDKLDHLQTQRLVLSLVEEHPELIDKIDGYVNAIATKAPAQKTYIVQPLHQKTVNTAQIKASVRQIFRDAVYGWENGNDHEDDNVNEGLLSLIQTAVEYCEKGDANKALASLEAITDVCASDWDDVADYGADNDEVVQALNEAWCEAILTADLTPEERTDIQINLETWHSDWNADFGLANAALTQGWDYPPLVQILSGNISSQGIWLDEEIPDYAHTLALIRLKILERQERYQEYLYLAGASGETKQYLTMLGRLGRVDDAVVGARKMSTMEEAFALAQTLQQQRALEQALDVAQQGFNLPGNCGYDLGIWTAKLAEELGDVNLAILARKNAFYARPSLADYQIIENLAGDDWENIKLDLLEGLRNSTIFGVIEDKVNIFLSENLVDDAIACVTELSSYYSELIHRVLDAAIPINPEWVIENSRRRAEKIMDAGKSEYYYYAVEWLKKARAAYISLDKQAEWKKYYNDLLQIHSRKRKLVELLKQKEMQS